MNISRFSAPPQALRVPDSAAGVSLWRVEFDTALAPAPRDLALLDAAEHARLQRYHRNADRVRFAATRAALRRLLAPPLACPPRALRFTSGPHGKPALVGAGPHFNVSHAGAYALIGLSEHRQIGVDIERCDGALDVAELAPQVLSERELGQVSTAADFFLRWTCKEAVLKALGLGLAGGMPALAVLPQPGRRLRVEHAWSDYPALQAWRLDAPPGYACALALA